MKKSESFVCNFYKIPFWSGSFINFKILLAETQLFNSFEMDEIRILDKNFRLYIRSDKITEAVVSMSLEINKDYAGRELTIIVMLKGAMVFAMELIKYLQIPCRFETISAKSYGLAMESSGNLKIQADFSLFEGKDVLIVEDIIDSGLTISAVLRELEKAKPLSIAVASMFSKPAMHKTFVQTAYLGMEIEPNFIVGYGLDYAEYGRELADVYQLAE